MDIAKEIIGAAVGLGLFWLAFRAVDDPQPARRWSVRDLLPWSPKTDP
jgi:hypothetical protein